MSERNATIALTANQSGMISEAKIINKRKVLEINNLNAIGGADVFVTVGVEAAANIGRRVQPGQTIIWSQDAGYMPPQGRVFGFSTANTNLSVYEEVQ